jgi:hypothetical protein
MDADRFGHEFAVSAWPGPPFAKLAGACDGMEVIALLGATTKSGASPLDFGFRALIAYL